MTTLCTSSHRPEAHHARAAWTPVQNPAHQHSERGRNGMEYSGYNPAGRQGWYHYPGHCSPTWQQYRTY